MPEITGSLAYGGSWRLTPDVLELVTADGKAARIFAVRDIRAVTRNSYSVRLVFGGGDFAEIETASTDEAQRLERGVLMVIPQGAPSSPPITRGVAPEPQKSGSGSVLGWLFVIAAALVVLVMVTDSSRKGTNPQTSAAPAGPTIGEQGVLRSKDGTPLPVSSTKEVDDRFSKAAAANDTTAIRNMILNDQIFMVESGTTVLVIDSGGALASLRQIRILSGTHNAKSGWVPFEWVQK